MISYSDECPDQVAVYVGQHRFVWPQFKEQAGGTHERLYVSRELGIPEARKNRKLLSLTSRPSEKWLYFSTHCFSHLRAVCFDFSFGGFTDMNQVFSSELPQIAPNSSGETDSLASFPIDGNSKITRIVDHSEQTVGLARKK
jgi:hypothetical protein